MDTSHSTKRQRSQTKQLGTFGVWAVIYTDTHAFFRPCVLKPIYLCRYADFRSNVLVTILLSRPLRTDNLNYSDRSAAKTPTVCSIGDSHDDAALLTPDTLKLSMGLVLLP